MVGWLFVGIPLTAELRDGLETYLHSVFGRWVPGYRVPPRTWHLTLRFLGPTDAERHRRLRNELRRMEPGPPFTVSLERPGAFPSAARASVLWIAIGDGAEELRALASQVDAAAVHAGYRPGRRPFSPYLMLSRLVVPAVLHHTIESAAPFGGRMVVDEIVLFRRRGRTPYERMLTVPLAS